ncbi:GntR family transcriptional regulator [Pseudomonas protegens]|uniref:Transcriptional regulator, GntR family/amidohydrolase family protein n=2 Tax=Pseudomonas protegens TaxID=380021 RepID=Q4KAS3_PSEF5|nr:amidohydrolase family protein [Pseudomonas protegens]AAY92824.1 transcriptional regulator, GntR family/amidohydrolase family protein [Pseudomonas protegens Pf-5]ASE22992.1 FCD domain-containing protein [Pseudomonas protegens]QEZ53319.1 GntR family transcriptional regulator [Pseudomonas protegens]QEZ60474.1 GntR family transcriptional regulator [Pseudomonas protegens]QIC31504.1 amidohydrolase family protein [Pseudomonas protegens]
MTIKAIGRRDHFSVEIFRHLESEIREGRLRPGDRIPTESRLAEAFAVSRNVVREAVARLNSAGLVVSRQGLGVFVATEANQSSFRITQEELTDSTKLRQLYELRLDLEVAAAAMAARRRSLSQLNKIEAALDTLRASIQNRQDMVEHSLQFKRAIADATGNEYFRNFIIFLCSHVYEAALLENHLVRSSDLGETLLAEHQAIFEAIRLGDPDLARRVTWQQIINSAERNGLRGLQGWEITRMSSLGETYAPQCAGPAPEPRTLPRTLPDGACDCHFHVFGDENGQPFSPHRSYTPPPAPLEAFQRVQKTLGLSRGVIVQPSVYGADNSTTLAALKEAGSAFRGVVVIDADTDTETLWAMHRLGVRGVRVNLIFKSGVEVSDVAALAEKVAPLGWHLQLLIDITEFADLYETVASLPVAVVIDHMGHMPTSCGLGHPGFTDLLRLLKEGRVWVKLSGAYRFTASKDFPYDDVTPYARALIEANPNRLLWASDWPHPCIPVPMPNDASLLEMLFNWVENDDALIKQILVDNPAKLYGF